MIPLIDEENESYLKEEIYHICKKEFIFDIDSCIESMYTKYRRVRDHCHYAGKYRGAAQNNYDLNYKESKEVLVVFHSASVYD